MRRLGLWLFHASALLAFAAGNLPYVWTNLAGNTDPRAEVGAWRFILHHNAEGMRELAVRGPDGMLRRFHYAGAVLASQLYGGGWLLWVVAAAWRREQSKRLGADRRRLGRCAGCGYDLTGNASGACPECGRAAERTEV
ncbi:MAG: hypothetical protein JWO31_1265 [Phycisphaerales bacterium]|nr:hypothetical protein [Phycisphaerales bacterium]